MPRIYFRDDNVTANIKQGETLMKACGEEGTSIAFGCRQGRCGTCLTTIVKGNENLAPPDIHEQLTLQAIEAKPGQRLSCQAKVLGDVTVSSPWGKKSSCEQAWFEEER